MPGGWPFVQPGEKRMGILIRGYANDSISVLHHNRMEDFESMERTDGRHRDGDLVKNRHTTDVEERESDVAEH